MPSSSARAPIWQCPDAYTLHVDRRLAHVLRGRGALLTDVYFATPTSDEIPQIDRWDLSPV